MRKFLITLVIALSGTPVSAQSQNSLLWKVVAPNGVESHLFGTYHLLGSDYLTKNEKVKTAWEKAETVVVEMVVDSSKIMEVAMAGMMPSRSLKQMVSEEDYQILKQRLEPVLGMDLAMADQMKPLTLNLTYSVNLATSQTPDSFFFEGIPIDLFLAQNRAEDQKLIPLESMMEQMDILYGSQSLEEQAEDLVQIVRNHRETLKTTKQILNAYMEQNLDKMLALSEEYEESFGDLDVLLDQRNLRWVEKLEPLLQKGEVFIAVGALHLPGEMGLIKLLKEKGYKLEAVL